MVKVQLPYILDVGITQLNNTKDSHFTQFPPHIASNRNVDSNQSF